MKDLNLELRGQDQLLQIGGCSYDVSLRCEHFHWGFGFRNWDFRRFVLPRKEKILKKGERQRTFLSFLFQVSDPSFHLTYSTTEKSTEIEALPRASPEHVDLTPYHNIQRPMPLFVYILGVPYLLQEGSPKMVSQCAGAASLWCKLSCLHRTWL